MDILMLGIHAYFLISFIGFNETIPEPDDTVSMVGYILFVCNQHNGIAIGMYLVKDLHDLIRSFCIKITSWLISKNDRRIIYQCSCNRHPLTLSTTQFIWLVMAPVTKIDQVHNMFCFVSTYFLTHPGVH